MEFLVFINFYLTMLETPVNESFMAHLDHCTCLITGLFHIPGKRREEKEKRGGGGGGGKSTFMTG